MSNDIEYLNGLIFKAPHENAPAYVKAKVSIKRTDLIEALQAREGDWINLELKVSKGGNWHAPIDTWKPNGTPRSNAPKPQRAPEPDFVDDDLPF